MRIFRKKCDKKPDGCPSGWLFFYFYFRQVAGANKTSIGNTSKRPASISKIYTSFEKSLNPANEPAGPTAPSPGPMLFIVATTEVKFVVKSKPSKDINKSDTTKIKA